MLKAALYSLLNITEPYFEVTRWTVICFTFSVVFYFGSFLSSEIKRVQHSIVINGR